jgi:sulfite reductase (NADPH) hemoprotein beta-component
MTDEVSRNERIKEASDYLRGTLAEGLREEITGAIVEDDQQLVKFHGMYLQDDRDLRSERTRKKMEKAFSFHDPRAHSRRSSVGRAMVSARSCGAHLW